MKMRVMKTEIQLFTTLKCNIQCSYCVMDVGDVLWSQGKASYTIDDLDNFIQTNIKNDYYFTFFGGEPTLNVKFIENVMNRFPDKLYQIQTNGTLLSKLDASILEKFDNFLISIDGGKETTDKYRGKGVYDSVIDNVSYIRDIVNGSLTARMTYCDSNLTIEEVDELFNYFNYVHFQFAQYEGVYTLEDMNKKKHFLDCLVDRFFNNDELYKVVPLMGITRNLLFPQLAFDQCNGSTQCRVSTNIVNIRPDGEIYACPDMTWSKSMHHGSVKNNYLKESPLQLHKDMPCNDCIAYTWCRGNCMKNLWRAYVDNNEEYRNKVVEPVCELVKYLGDAISRYDIKKWYNSLSEANKNEILYSKLYNYTEIVP